MFVFVVKHGSKESQKNTPTKTSIWRFIKYHDENQCVIFLSKYVINKFSNSISDKRFILWKPALKAIKENHYIFGEGLGNGNELINHYIQNNNLNQFKSPDLHNQYLMNYKFYALLQ